MINNKKITVKKVFLSSVIVFAGCVLLNAVIRLAETHLPPNKITHACMPRKYEIKDNDLANGSVNLFKDLASQSENNRAFCGINQYAKFKDSWPRLINNITVPLGLMALLFSIPSGSILLSRQLTKLVQ